ncbi:MULTISPECIES: DUF805 domain-containing protein [unclassified Rhizobium]|uniref:DUF805 domain-containing protein n=1 Tax=unclassified Rhizobium TaxID=2613769 RepID=UPI000271A9C6|nr:MULTISPECIES: DUF805 domain-containing protein [unclassified Rhizobium]EJL49150.1 putative membrane protein [Rhizobium sp. CF122]MBB3398731.1 uncharacterized membrane protein YhaH (DUF805 family) [Rhizobium sp. BK060]MBB4171409.1 uncharacterized membrane protein YhaH (DUF805 family) [Rhizobium sp. BK538]TCM68912.1 uncharacterized membrane protein YhaH (DUF805 family) [Rhizobium sp. BK068]
MGFTEAVSTVFSKYAVFSGRAGRPEFWWFALFNVIASLILAFLDKVLFGYEILGALYGLAVLLPGLGVAVRRLHDIGRSGWWILVGVIPLVGWIVLLVWYVSRGTPGFNEYGAPA